MHVPLGKGKTRSFAKAGKGLVSGEKTASTPVGRRGSPLKVKGANTPKTINARTYTGACT